MRATFIMAMTLGLLIPSFVLAGGKIPTPKKDVVISGEQAAALTNRTEQLLHQIRMPEVDFRQANVADILAFLNGNIRERGATAEAKRLSIELTPATRKKLMHMQKWEGGGGYVGIYTFSGLDMSVLEAVQLLQAVGQLEREVQGGKLILSLKKQQEQVQQDESTVSVKAAPSAPSPVR